MRLPWFVCCGVALLAGCAGEGPPPGPGRFAHSAIHKTIAPWDGPAVQLYLAEKPMPGKAPVAPFVSVRIYRPAAELSGQRVRLGGEESRAGHAQWVPRQGQAGPLSWVEVTFEGVKEGEPVRGSYEVAFPDGGRERGRFEAAWWPPDGHGG